MPYIKVRKQADGSTHYTAVARLRSGQTIVHQEARIFAHHSAAVRWAKHREVALDDPAAPSHVRPCQWHLRRRPVARSLTAKSPLQPREVAFRMFRRLPSGSSRLGSAFPMPALPASDVGSQDASDIPAHGSQLLEERRVRNSARRGERPESLLKIL
jgi:hypothetical protein